jgi:hypothetical protein
MASKETRSLGFAVAALVGFGAMMVWVLTGSSTVRREEAGTQVADDQPAQSAPSSSSVPAPAAKAAPAEPTPAPPPPVDLFAGPMPDFMAASHARVLDKKQLDVEAQKELYHFGQEHKDDARPQLLLAWDSMNREWDGIGVRMYRMAYHADKRAKDDPSMLHDLLSVASRFDQTEYKEATDIIREAYGAQALPQLDVQLADLRSHGDLVGAARLQRLRTLLSSH